MVGSLGGQGLRAGVQLLGVGVGGGGRGHNLFLRVSHIHSLQELGILV